MQPKKEKKVVKEEVVAPAKPKVAPAKKPKALSPSMKLILGDWKGDKATAFTRYLDFNFRSDGKGKRDNIPFRWEMIEKSNSQHLKISWIKTISKAEYNNIRSNADEMMPEGRNVTTYITNSKKDRVIVENGKFYLITGMEIFKITVLNKKRLVLSAKSTKGKTINTYHIKQ